MAYHPSKALKITFSLAKFKIFDMICETGGMLFELSKWKKGQNTTHNK
jgi:hypothetical protein